jgi:hypothetical protein
MDWSVNDFKLLEKDVKGHCVTKKELKDMRSSYWLKCFCKLKRNTLKHRFAYNWGWRGGTIGEFVQSIIILCLSNLRILKFEYINRSNKEDAVPTLEFLACIPSFPKTLWGWHLSGGKIFKTGPGAHSASYTMGIGSFPGVKRTGRGVNHPTLLAPRLKNGVELYLYSPSGPSWTVIGWTLPSPLLYRIFWNWNHNSPVTLNAAFRWRILPAVLSNSIHSQP